MNGSNLRIKRIAHIIPPNPEMDDLLHMMGRVGGHLAKIEASEGAAGNISVCLRSPKDTGTVMNLEPRTRFPGLQFGPSRRSARFTELS